MKRNLWLVSSGTIVTASLISALAACGSSTGGGYSASSTPPVSAAVSAQSATAQITIAGSMFDAPPVKAGTTVTVVNTDAVSHTLTVKGQGIDVKLGAGETGSFTAPTTPGDYPLSCDVHPSMQGTLTVT